MASFDPRMYQMHVAASMHGVMNNVAPGGGRYTPAVGPSGNMQQAGLSSQQRQTATTPEAAKVSGRSGPGWEGMYRTAQNIGFPEATVACGETVGEYIEYLAKGIGCPVEYILVPLLPCIGSILGTGTSIRVHRAWSEPPVLWTIVGASKGSRRSAVIRQLLSPILTLQADAEAKEKELRTKKIIPGSPDDSNSDKNTTTLEDKDGRSSSHNSPEPSNSKVGLGSRIKRSRALYSGTRITLAALTEVLHRNDGHAFSLTENVENLHEMLGLLQPVIPNRMVSVMEDLYEGLPLVAVEDGKVTTILGSNFCHGGFAYPEYMVYLMLKSPAWFSSRVLMSCPQVDDMKGVFGEIPTDRDDMPELETLYSILIEKHKGAQTYMFSAEAIQELNNFFEDEWGAVLNQLDQNEHEGIIVKSMGQIVRLCGVLAALKNGINGAREVGDSGNQSWDWNIDAETVKCGISLGKYFLEQKLAMTFMVGTGFFKSTETQDNSLNGRNGNNGTPLNHSVLSERREKESFMGQSSSSSYSQGSASPSGTPRQLSLESNLHLPPTGPQSTTGTPFSSQGKHGEDGMPGSYGIQMSKQPAEVDFRHLPQTMTTAEEDVSEMMQAVDFVHFSKTQFVGVHGRRIKRLMECYDDGHGVSATTAAQKSITPPVHIEGTNNRHPAWASALFFQKVAELGLGSAEQNRHPTNKKVCWRFKRKPVNQLTDKDLQLLQYLRVEMDKYSQFGPGPLNPSVMVNSGLITVPQSNSPGPHEQIAALANNSRSAPNTDDDSNSNSPSLRSIKTEAY